MSSPRLNSDGIMELQDLASHFSERNNENSDTNPSSTSTYPSGFKLFMITLGLVLSILLAALDSTIIATAIPSITSQFGSIANIAWYGSAYSITNTAFISAWGKAYQQFPLKPTFLTAVAVFEAGNVVCATSASSEILILGRVVAGLGGGGIMTGSFIMITLTAKPTYRAAYMGVLGVTFGCASVMGPLMGGALTDGPGWRWCFWISLPIGFVAASVIATFFVQPHTAVPSPIGLTRKLANLNLNGGILVTGSLACFVLAMHWGGTHPWNSPQVIASLAGFAIFAAFFIMNEWLMGSKAMIEARFLKKRAIVLNLGTMFFIAGLYFPLLYVLPIQFQSVDNESAKQSGVRLIPLVLGVSVFTMVSNGLLTFWRHHNPFMVAGALFGTVGVAFIYTLDAKTSTGAWTAFEILAAAGIGLALQIPMIANQTHVASDDIPAVTTLTLFVENVGTSLFIAAAEAAFTNGLIVHLRDSVPTVDPTLVVNTGVTQLRLLFGASELQGIVVSYLEGCKTSYMISVSCGAAAALISIVAAAPSSAREIKKRIRRGHSA